MIVWGWLGTVEYSMGFFASLRATGLNFSFPLGALSFHAGAVGCGLGWC